MVFDRNYMRSTVARRMFMLFVLAALLPVVVAGVWSLITASRILTEQAEEQLKENAKTLGVSVYERLGMAEMTLKELAQQYQVDNISFGTHIGQQQFSAIAVLNDAGLTGIRGDLDSIPALSEENLEHIASGNPLLLSQRTAANFELLLLTAAGGSGEILVAQLLPDYIWGNSYYLPGQHQMCVLWSDRSPLYCSSEDMKLALTMAMPDSLDLDGDASIYWRQNDRKLLGQTWEVALERHFGHEPWVLLIGKPDHEVLANVTDFRVVFVTVFLAALLIAALITMSQIRKRMVPLEKLATYAGHVSNKRFHEPLEVDSGDEFEGLAISLRKMSRGLASHFSILATMSLVDREILSSPEPGAVVDIVLSRLRNIVPCDNAVVTVLDRAAPKMAQNYLLLAGEAQSKTKRIKIDRDLDLMFGDAKAGIFLDKEKPPGFCQALVVDGAASMFCMPIIKSEKIYGVLTLGYCQPPELGGNLMHQASEICGRLALAMATVERDEQLYHQAHFDNLTGLANRQLFAQRLNMEIRRAERDHSSLALLFIDLDNFKIINDVRGHSAGDQLIRKVAGRLSERVRDSDLISRLGGDEFTVLLSTIDGEEDAGRVAKEILESLQKPFTIDGSQHFISASIGVTLYPGDGRTVEELLRNADTAMYRAKEAGRDQCMFFQEEMNLAAVRRVKLESQLRTVVESQGMKLHFQPVLDAQTQEVVGAEALMRWPVSCDQGPSPDEFIPVAEETGLIVPLGYAALEEACRAMMAWRTKGIELENIAVNVSPRQFNEPGFVSEVLAILDRHGLEPHFLELEITESLLLEEVQRIRMVLEELCRHEIRLAIDDFGTGYSALGYLRRYPVQTIKIDRSFVNEIDQSESPQKLTRAIIAMSHGLGKRVVAEGVENQRQFDVLAAQGCDLVQGHLFSHAMPIDTFASYARKQNGKVMMKALVAGDK
ncbi:MAG: EAL domain-containing protein [Gammaproteobacteria bacterium]|nr:EAL domain-containing protein [Gammaproteobacteria bacterium]